MDIIILIVFISVMWLILQPINTIFKIDKEDEYLKYLHNNTTRKFRKLSDNEYVCDVLSFYIKLENDRALCTREFRFLGRQTANGPFCHWFTLEKHKVHFSVH
jgi:hypothetical protein